LEEVLKLMYRVRVKMGFRFVNGKNEASALGALPRICERDRERDEALHSIALSG